MNEPTAAAVAPESTDPTASLEAWRSREAEPVVEPAPIAPVVDEEPVDPELAREIDTLAPPVKDETPQQKAARTRDYRERGRKGLVSRLGNERDAARAENARLKAQIEASQRAPVAAAPAGATPAAPSAASAPSVGDPRDPEPTYDSFLKAHPDHPDPYAGFLREQGKWDRRQEARQVDQQQRQASATSAVNQATATYRERVETVRQAHPNYYDVVDPFVAALKDHPYSPAITQAVLGDPEHGPLVLFRLASDRETARTVYTAPSVSAALVQLGIVSASVNATPAPKPAAPVIPAPLAPITPVGGSALPSGVDPTSSLAAWRKSGLAQSRAS